MTLGALQAVAPVLYAIVCGSPMARNVERLVDHAQRDGWDVWVVASPDGRRFIDVPAVVSQTGHPVRSYYKYPGEPDLLPPADAIVAAPATVNTITKWAMGITDTLPLGLLVEGQGKGLPIVAMPYTNSAMGAHPAFLEALDRLRGWGVRVIFGAELPLHPPGKVEQYLDRFPWHLAVSALYGLPNFPLSGRRNDR